MKETHLVEIKQIKFCGFLFYSFTITKYVMNAAKLSENFPQVQSGKNFATKKKKRRDFAR